MVAQGVNVFTLLFIFPFVTIPDVVTDPGPDADIDPGLHPQVDGSNIYPPTQNGRAKQSQLQVFGFHI